MSKLEQKNTFLKYRLTGLPYTNGSDHPVQKATLKGDYLYIIQVYTGKYGKFNSAVVARQQVDDDTNIVDFSDAETMHLYGFGHTQTLEPFSHNGQDYIWVGTKGVEYNNEYWSTQLARIKFEDNTSYHNNTETQRLSALDRANETGDSYIPQYGKQIRIDASLSYNKHLLITSIDENGNCHLSVYDNEKINNQLDEQPSNGHLSIGDLSDCLIKGKKPFVINSLTSTNVVGSVQGFAITNADSIYISSGRSSETSRLYKYFWNHKWYSKGVQLVNGHWKGIFETESVQIVGEKLFVGFDITQSNIKENRVYMIDKSNLDV